jgi:iron complex outermembrane receptor protein
MNRNFFLYISGIGILFACIFLGIPNATSAASTDENAIPYNKSDNEPFSLPEIVVTSQKYEQKINEIPISITHYSDIDLDDSHIINTNDVIFNTPNIFARTPIGHEAYSFVNIRGIVTGNADFFSPTVGLFSDGMSINGGLDPLLHDIQSIEVLRGPQGTLYGGNTLGGAIVVKSKQPKFQ